LKKHLPHYLFIRKVNHLSYLKHQRKFNYTSLLLRITWTRSNLSYDFERRNTFVEGFLYFLNSVMTCDDTRDVYKTIITSNFSAFLSKYLIISISYSLSKSCTATIFSWWVNMKFWDCQYSILNGSSVEDDGVEFITW
jgi:restriction endonuclease S subunit